MNDEEVEVLSTEQEQTEQPGQPARRGETIDESLGRIQSGMNDAGRIVENFGKGQEKVGNWMSGGEKGAKAASNAGTAASSGAAKGLDAASKAAAAREKAAAGAEKVADATAKAAKGTKTAAKLGEVVSEVGSKTADAEREGSKAAANIPYAGPAISAVGQTVAGIQKGLSESGKAVSKGTHAAAEGTEKAAEAAKHTAGAAKKEAKLEKNAAKAGAITAKAGSKKTFADKLKEHGKLNQLRGKRLRELSEKFKADKYLEGLFETGGKVGKVLKGILKVFDPRIFGVVVLLLLTVATIIVSYIMSPLFFMRMINQNLKSNPDNIEKVYNFIGGLGFQDSKQAFYDEVNYLNIHYGKEIDFPYIMSALYYPEIYSNGNNYYGSSNTTKFCRSYDLTTSEGKQKCSKLQVGVNFSQQFLKKYVQEATTTLGEDGLIYSANRIYRLRELVQHQMLSDQLKTVDLFTYIEMCKERMGNEMTNIMKDIPILIFLVYALHDPVAGGVAQALNNAEYFKDILNVFYGTENWKSIEIYLKGGKYNFDEVERDLRFLIKTFYNCFFKVEKVEFDIPDIPGVLAELTKIDKDKSWIDKVKDAAAKAIPIKITYHDYAYNEVAFEDYLVNEYIPEMPEYQKYLLDSDGNKLTGDNLNDKVMKIAYEIRNIKQIFDGLYNLNKSAEDETQCIGNINLDLLDEVQPPIDLEEGQKITFSGENNYGFYKGTIHNGVDLEDVSTNTKAGDNVYSIYDGKVVESTVDDTLSDKTVKGGWLVIDYRVQYSDSEDEETGVVASMFKSNMSDIRVYYGGLDPKTISLKQNDIVKKGQVIGKVGDTSCSENGTRPSLHFAIYDMSNQIFLNPINMFITCRASSDKMCGSNNEQKIWTFLMSKGYTKEAAAGIMGVWQRESSFKPYIVQNHTDSYSKDYTAKIDNGAITKNKFAKDGPGGGGYGLAQWTYYTRKEKLYDFAKGKGKSIGSLEVQLEFFEKEINSDSFKGVKSKLNDKKTVEEATEYFLTGPYQGGTKASLKERINNAKEIYNKYKDFECK